MNAASRASSGSSTDTSGDRRATLGLAFLLALVSLPSLAAPAPVQTARAVEREHAQLLLDPNTATHDELMLLPGIGPVLADNIIACRAAAQTAPAFATPDDLDRVPRIGPLTIAKLRPYLRFPAASEADARPVSP